MQPAELLNCAWTHPKYRHRAGNVLALRQRHADLSAWVAFTVASSRSGRMISRFLNLATVRSFLFCVFFVMLLSLLCCFARSVALFAVQS